MTERGRAPGPRRPVKKRFGQHFLETNWVRKVVAAIAPRPDEFFLEIGPGRGQLTTPLAAAGSRVVAIEVDRDLADDLRQTSAAGVDVVTDDVLEADILAHLDRAWGTARPVRVVGNLPYNLSSPILFRLLELHRTDPRFIDATLMLQREVAERVAGRPGTRDYGPLAILCQLSAEADVVLRLPPGAFRPPPRVESALVRLTFRPPPVELGDPALFNTMVRSLFSQRRKTLANALRPFAASLTDASPRALLETAGLAAGVRAETLDLGALARLARAIGAARRPG